MKVQINNKKYIPLILSLLVPGLGQIIKNQWGKGLSFIASLFAIYGLIIIAMIIFGEMGGLPLVIFFGMLGYIAMILVYIFQLIDAYKN